MEKADFSNLRTFLSYTNTILYNKYLRILDSIDYKNNMSSVIP